jgi:hypothetical protein
MNNWNDGSEDYNIIAGLRRDLKASEAREVALRSSLIEAQRLLVMLDGSETTDQQLLQLRQWRDEVAALLRAEGET